MGQGMYMYMYYSGNGRTMEGVQIGEDPLCPGVHLGGGRALAPLDQISPPPPWR